MGLCLERQKEEGAQHSARQIRINKDKYRCQERISLWTGTEKRGVMVKADKGAKSRNKGF